MGAQPGMQTCSPGRLLIAILAPSAAAINERIFAVRAHPRDLPRHVLKVVLGHWARTVSAKTDLLHMTEHPYQVELRRQASAEPAQPTPTALLQGWTRRPGHTPHGLRNH